MVSIFVLRIWVACSLDGFVFLALAKAISSLHADGQLRIEHAQVGTYFEIKNLSESEVIEFTQTLSEQAGHQQRRRETFRRDAGTHPFPLLFHEFMNVQLVTRLKYTKQKHRMASCNPLSSNDLRMANFRAPSVYFRH